VRVVIDHLAGSRRGQRQELAAEGRIRFGRHPDCEVAFDPVRDIDASSRHAELRPVDSGWVLVDIGSSNGTYVDGRRVTEAKVIEGVPLHVEFGHDGPQLRLFMGDPDALAHMPIPQPVRRKKNTWVVPAIIGAIVLMIVTVIVLATR
jgi:pSer/pThr/pTyr-binding forkhead associated (FHA) protein